MKTMSLGESYGLIPVPKPTQSFGATSIVSSQSLQAKAQKNALQLIDTRARVGRFFSVVENSDAGNASMIKQYLMKAQMRDA